MDKANSSTIHSSLNTSTDTNIKVSSMMYKRRPPTPTRFNKRFELGNELDGDTSSKSSKLNPEVEREEMALKDELLRIFHREKDAMEQHYLNKIQELLRSFKGKKIEWEDMVKSEREDLESQFEGERSEMHQSFATEISKLTRVFQEEKSEMERIFDAKLRNRESEFDREKNSLQENWKNQLESVKRQCQVEHEAMLTIEMKSESEKHKNACEHLEKRFENSKYDMEKKFERDMAETETRHNKACFDMEKKQEEEKNKIDRECQRKIEHMEDKLRKEVNLRAQVEHSASNEKTNLQAVIAMLKEEIGRLKEEIERLRKLPAPPPEVKIIEKTIQADPPVMYYNSRADLPSNLREDFDRIINEYKENLKDKFQRDKSAMEEKLENEKERLRERINKEKDELDKRLSEEKFRMERDLDRSRDDIEKEIERRLRTKQLSDSLATQQQRFDEVTKRLEEEEKNRRETMLENDRRKYEAIIQDLSHENDGLKTKVKVLEDNNTILKNLKEEGQHEVERLRRAVEELKTIVEAKRDNDRTRCQTPAEFSAPFLMSMMQQERDREPTSQKTNLDDLSFERRKLEELKSDLEKQERDIREKRTMEDAVKMAADKSQEKYDILLFEKRKLEDALKALETRVVAMQDDFMRMRYIPQPNTQPPQPPAPPTHHVITQPQPIIVQPSYPPHPPAPPIDKSIEFNMPSPQAQLQPSTPQYPYYMPMQPPTMQPPTASTPNDHSEKIQKLKTAKNRLNDQVDELQSELREANHENNLLQKQCREFERQLEKLGDALEREREISTNIRDMLSDEKTKANKLKDDLDRESQNVIRTRNDVEEMKMKFQREIQELQAKLHHAGQTLAAVRQQASNDITTSTIMAGYPTDATVGMVTLPPMPQMSSLLAANAARRRHSAKLLNVSRESFFDQKQTMVSETQETQVKDELTRIRGLEEEKMRLQSQLDDAKGALDAYAGKLDNQLHNLQSKVHESSSRTKELTEENVTLNKAVHALGVEQTNQARQNFHLRQQKMQLQRLIERLTAMNPQPPPY